MNAEFNEWWNEDLLTEDNPFVDGTPAYWAWEGWCAAVKVEREGCHALRQTLPNPYDHCQVSAHAHDMAIAAYGAAIRARSNT
jgi:hypothetical protein